MYKDYKNQPGRMLGQMRVDKMKRMARREEVPAGHGGAAVICSTTGGSDH